MKGLWSALAFLTILPVGRDREWPGAAVLPWFPVVGLIIGGLWAGFDQIAGRLLPSTLRALLDLLALVLLTGGLHLDGLADTADGLFSHRGPDESLRIMKDSRTGNWGVLALLSVFGAKGLALYEILLQNGWLFLILVPVYGRAAMLAGIVFLPYGRGEEGIGHRLFEEKRPVHLLLTSLVLLALGSILLFDSPGIVIVNGIFLGVVAAILLGYRCRLGCVTGDMLGAMGETTETAVLVVLAAS